MVHLGEAATWLKRRRALVLVLIGWVALLVISAGPKTSDGGWLAIPDLQGAIAAALGLVALLGAVMLPFMLGRRAGLIERPKKLSLRAAITLLAVVLALMFFLGPDESDNDSVDSEPTESTVASVEVEAEPGGDTSVGWLLVPVVVAGALLLWSRRQLSMAQTGGSVEPEPSLGVELAPAIGRAADMLSPAGDPRTAVMAAYASLERTLEDLGRGRNPSETPTEHMARVLAGIPDVADPAVRLGALYERARFSSDEISQDDQRRAATALDGARRNVAPTVERAP